MVLFVYIYQQKFTTMSAARRINEMKIAAQRLFAEDGYIVGVCISKNTRELESFGNKSYMDVINDHKEEIFNHPSYYQRDPPTKESTIFTRPTKAVAAMNKIEAKIFVTELLTFLLGRKKGMGDMSKLPDWWSASNVCWKTQRLNPQTGTAEKGISREENKAIIVAYYQHHGIDLCQCAVQTSAVDGAEPVDGDTIEVSEPAELVVDNVEEVD